MSETDYTRVASWVTEEKKDQLDRLRTDETGKVVRSRSEVIRDAVTLFTQMENPYDGELSSQVDHAHE